LSPLFAFDCLRAPSLSCGLWSLRAAVFAVNSTRRDGVRKGNASSRNAKPAPQERRGTRTARRTRTCSGSPWLPRSSAPTARSFTPCRRRWACATVNTRECPRPSVVTSKPKGARCEHCARCAVAGATRSAREYRCDGSPLRAQCPLHACRAARSTGRSLRAWTTLRTRSTTARCGVCGVPGKGCLRYEGARVEGRLTRKGSPFWAEGTCFVNNGYESKG
jgi:hypothetical protein